MFSPLLRSAAIIAAALVLCVTARGQDADPDCKSAECKAKAALALAKAKREREAVKAKEQTQLVCHTDYAAAVKEAEKSGKPMVLWVGVQCADYPALRKALGNAVHCHMTERRGQKEPGIVIMGGDGIEYFVRPEKITVNTADKIKEAWARPYTPPPIRSDVRIQEEISRRPFRRSTTLDISVPRAGEASTSSPAGTPTALTTINAPRAERRGGISAGLGVGVGPFGVAAGGCVGGG